MSGAPAVAEGDILALHVSRFADVDPEVVRREAADTAMADLADALEAPDYTGDVQTALIHHMRRDAFDGYLLDNVVRNYVELAAEIEEEDATSDSGPVPVLFSYQLEEGASGSVDGRPNVGSAFVAVDLDAVTEPQFHSHVEHRRGIREHGFTDKIAVTKRTLALVGTTIEVEGEDLVSGPGPTGLNEGRFVGRFRPVVRDELVLSETTQTSGRNSVKPPTEHVYDEAQKETDRFWGGALHIVGWEAIDAAIKRHILAIETSVRPSIEDGRGQALQYVNGLREFFKSGDQLDAFLANASIPLKRVFVGANGFNGALRELTL